MALDDRVPFGTHEVIILYTRYLCVSTNSLVEQRRNLAFNVTFPPESVPPTFREMVWEMVSVAPATEAQKEVGAQILSPMAKATVVVHP